MIIFILGKSGSGKTTIGMKLKNDLNNFYNKKFILIDGDDIRSIYNDKIGHSLKDRRKNALRILNFCKFLDKQKIDIVVSVLSIFPDILKSNRESFEQYFEIYLKVNHHILTKKRDFKGVYKLKKNVVGKDIPFPIPRKPDLIIDNNSEIINFDSITSKIIKSINKKYKNFI